MNGKQASASTQQHVFLQLTTLKHFDSDVLIVCIWICDLICVDLHVERYDWRLYLVFLSVAFDDFDDSFFVQMKVVESLDQKAESLLMDLMDCLVA